MSSTRCTAFRHGAARPHTPIPSPGKVICKIVDIAVGRQPGDGCVGDPWFGEAFLRDEQDVGPLCAHALTSAHHQHKKREELRVLVSDAGGSDRG
jgi:hypothetical protein